LLVVWDFENRKMIECGVVRKEGMTIACSPDGDELAIGCISIVAKKIFAKKWKEIFFLII
jgi:hypothetical protein